MSVYVYMCKYAFPFWLLTGHVTAKFQVSKM